MKQDKVINIILIAINMVLAVVCVVLYLGTDRAEPKFIIQPAEITYSPDMEETLLYEGIAAHDDRDGEITDKIVIEKKVENRAEGNAIVYYAVSDSAGNVAKFSKLFWAEYPVEVPAAVNDAGSGEQVMRQLEMDQSVSGGVAGDGNDGDGSAGVEPENDDGTGEDTEEDGSEAAEQDEDDSEEDAASGEDAGSDEEADEDRTDTAGRSSEDTRTTPEPAQPARNTGAPELVFSSTEVTINSGANVPWTEIISTLRDDKDDYATLYYNLQVSQYNRNRPGTYPVTVYTEDSDGNRSQTVPVTITVR